MCSPRPLAAVPVVVAVAVALGCDALTGPEPRLARQAAVLRFYGDPVVVQVPDTVPRATEFAVTVRSYGGGCIQQGDTEVRVSGRTVVIRPHDLFVTELPPDAACTDDLRLHTHRATLRFEEPGAVLVTIHGRERPGDAAVAVQRSVHVR